MNALQGQVGGDHYRKMGMQPFQFTMANRYDPLAHTINKYVARHESKGGKADLEKAIHCVNLRLELMGDTPPCLDVIGIDAYISANHLPPNEAVVLRNLHYWALRGTAPSGLGVPSSGMASLIISQIENLIAQRYPTQEDQE